MKRINAEFPYSNYWLYVVFHKKERRNQANLILKSDIKVRTTVSYARYLMAVKIGRFLEKDEQVDHIDNNCTNDVIDNLQILSFEQNRLKQGMLSWKETIMAYNCDYCGKEFTLQIKNFKYKKKIGQTHFCCSRDCSSNRLRKCC